MSITNKKPVKYTTYLAGPIENSTKEKSEDWRYKLSDLLYNPDLLIYNPLEQESYKVGKQAKDQVEYIKGLKKAGKYDLFFNEMWKIYLGTINKNTDLIQLLTNLRMRRHIDGNYRHEIENWGDFEAVVRSDFIIVYMPKDNKTVGTIFEITIALLFRIPIYLILPDVSKTDANSSLIFGNQISNNGKVICFYSVKECADYIKENYKLTSIKKKRE